MKKYVLGISALVLTTSTLIFTGCKKDDITAPVVTLTGGDEIISLQGKYTEKGATATDDKDGDLSSSILIEGSVNTNLAGVYSLVYSVTDAAGNVGEATRKVTVKNDADIYNGTYTTTDPDLGSVSPFDQTVEASKTENNVITFSRFAGRTGNTTITAKLTAGGDKFVLIAGTGANLGTNGCTYDYTPNGDGATITKISNKYVFSIKYNEERRQGGTNCTAVAKTPFEDKFEQK